MLKIAIAVVDSGNYKIALRDDLPSSAFETNLCHELYHIVQDNIGFPQIWPKNNNEKDFKALSTFVSSLVRDLKWFTRAPNKTKLPT